MGQAHEGSLQTQPVTRTDKDLGLETVNEYNSNSVNKHIVDRVEYNVVSVNDGFTNLLAVNPAQAYYVDGFVSGVRVSFMLDTGAYLVRICGTLYRRVIMALVVNNN